MVYAYTGPLAKLINEFAKMPGIGHKSAQRLAFYILSTDSRTKDQLVEAINDVKENVRFCKRCFNLATTDLCDICNDPTRDAEKLCIVAEPRDLIAMDRTNIYRGMYHVLGGILSPVNGIGPESLRIKELVERIQSEPVKEVTYAFNPTVEGEATIIYLNNCLRQFTLKTSRIAYGLPVGSDMDYADETTLTKAYEGRINI